MSSPAASNGLLSPTRTSRRKEKRNPSITPRRFGRFFTPRSSSLPTARRILGSLDSVATNRQPISPQSLFSDPLTSDPISPSPTKRLGGLEEDSRKRSWQDESDGQPAKRRVTINNEMPPPPLNFLRPALPLAEEDLPTLQENKDSAGNRRKATLRNFFKSSHKGIPTGKQRLKDNVEKATPVSKEEAVLQHYRPQPIRKFANRGLEAQLLSRQHGTAPGLGHTPFATPACDPRAETANFYSNNTDVAACNAHEREGNTIPFCVANGHRQTMTAVGDEEGYVRIFGNEGAATFFKVHDNAIMDISFSEDDTRLAAGGGNRSASIVDVPTLSVAAKLQNGHDDSLRQVSFQPGRGGSNVLASSDRAGRIQIWDLRCSSASISAWSTVLSPRDVAQHPFTARTINTLDGAHERTVQGITSSASVTAIRWFPAGREHLLLSASEANASVKLWDTRYIKSRRDNVETPLAITLEPASHTFRPYGITSLALSSDASRLYAVCKDNTVYAYSTPHLILGQGPELLHQADKRRPMGASGLGPLYGFKHDLFRAQSFYVKAALRPATNTSSELLAVGSSDSCPIIFPLNERYLNTHFARSYHHTLDATTPNATASFSSSCSVAPSASVPIFRAGTPLIRGHEREVTAVSWRRDGSLVSVSDDYSIRCWRTDDADRARYLRQVGEFGGERHMCGWADVGDDWDDDEA